MASDKRIILVTGGNNGIGFETSITLAAASPQNHVILSARTPAKGEEAIKKIEARKPQGTLSFLQLDVTDDDSIAAAAKKIETDFGRLDVLVNNAGIVVFGPLNRDTLNKTFDTNVYGVLLLTTALDPLLRKSKDLRIINVSSGLGSIAQRSDPNDKYYKMGGPATPYRISKAALNMITASLAQSFSDVKGKVWSYCPGYVVTDLTGPGDRENRVKNGAESAETSAEGIKEIVEGKRDSEVGTFVARFGQQYKW